MCLRTSPGCSRKSAWEKFPFRGRQLRKGRRAPRQKPPLRPRLLRKFRPNRLPKLPPRLPQPRPRILSPPRPRRRRLRRPFQKLPRQACPSQALLCLHKRCCEEPPSLRKLGHLCPPALRLRPPFGRFSRCRPRPPLKCPCRASICQGPCRPFLWRLQRRPLLPCLPCPLPAIRRQPRQKCRCPS